MVVDPEHRYLNEAEKDRYILSHRPILEDFFLGMSMTEGTR